MAEQIERFAAALADRYRIERELGAGGMATVYLAEDLKHHRRVAVKVLHPELAAVLGADRFLAEIRTTANLQHPHILPLHDSGQADGQLFYVMPYVEGETLRARLARERQLPIDESLRITREVASALDYAHRQGVIHRDIKPENILLHEGQALIADFGIALAVSSAGERRMTQTGMSLGTPEYMSPEQALGERTITAKSDVYALACVLYEMLTGEPPFTGATVQAIVGRVLNEEPRPISHVRKTVPPSVEAATLRALAKLPADRPATAGEFAGQLEAPVPTGFITTGAGSASWTRSVRLWQGAALVLAAVAVGLLVTLLGGDDGHTPVARVGVAGVRGAEDGRSALLMPQGRGFAFCDLNGTWQVRLWNRLSPTAMPGPAQQCYGAAFSPDGRRLAVLGQTAALQVVSVLGDTPPRTLADTGLGDISGFGGGIDWPVPDRIYIASRIGLFRVSVPDASRELVARPDSASRGFGDVDVLPDEQAGVVTIVGSSLNAARIGLVDLRTGEVTTLLQGVAARYVAPGHLLVAAADGTLRAYPFDSKSHRVTGDGIPLRDTVNVTDALGKVVLNVADDGTLFYRRAVPLASHIVLTDRNGREEELEPGWEATFQAPRVSADGARLAVSVAADGSEHLWVLDRGTGERTRLTLEGPNNSRLSWAPGSRGLTFVSTRDGEAALYQQPLNGSATALPRYDPRPIWGLAWTRDGRLLLRTDDQAPGAADILMIRPGDSVATPVVADPRFSEYAPEPSPDGRWLAYTSNETGRFEVMVRSLGDPASGRWQISANGGSEPAWSPDGRELFYRTDDSLYVAQIGTGPGFQVLSRRALFDASPYMRFAPFNRDYDVWPDGRRFVFLRRNEVDGDFVVVFNWLDELKALTADRVP
jgi:tRNA A-37 threonylcarbamoyl transferase component Bud32/WD40 repeat protein